MEKLLEFIRKYCSLLELDKNFHVSDSRADSLSNAYVAYENGFVRFSFLLDRGQMFLSVSSLKKPKRQYSLDIIRQYLLGEEVYKAELDDENGIFLMNRLNEIVDLFSPEKVESATSEFERLVKKRMKKMWG